MRHAVPLLRLALFLPVFLWLGFGNAKLAGGQDVGDAKVGNTNSPVNSQAESVLLGSLSAESSDPAASTKDVEVPQRAAFPKLRRIFFLPGDAPRLVPPDYWAVGIDELESALVQQSELIEPGAEVPQLVSALYVARFAEGALISDNESSVFDIAYRDDAPSTLLLGDMNLALAAQATNPVQSLTAKLVTMANGQVKVVVYRDCRLRFGWSRHGLLGADDGYQFDLRIPPCGRTRFLIGVPQAYRLSSRDGVVTQLPSPPQEVGVTGTQTPANWFSIEAGGLSGIRLAIAPTNPSADGNQVVVVRGVAVDCRVLPSGLDWRGTMVCDIPAGQSLPAIAVLGGSKVSSVMIDNQSVSWRETNSTEGETVLNFAALNSVSNKAATKRIQITGMGPFATESTGGGLSKALLPWLQVVGSPRVIAGSSHQLDLNVARPIRIAFLEQMDGWSIIENGTTDENQGNVLRLTGPADASPPIVSFVEATPRPQIDTVLRVTAKDSSLQAVWAATISSATGSLAPIRFRLQEGWRFNTAMIRGPDRVIDVQSEEIRDGVWTLWPEETDLVDGTIRLEATGEWDTVGNQELEEVPSSWFLQPLEYSGRAFTLVDHPPGMEWEISAAFRGRRLKSNQIDAGLLELVGPISDESLLFEVGNSGNPELRLYRPTAAFNSESHLDFRREGDQVVETLRLVFRVPAGRLGSVQISLGEALGRPPMQWTIASDDPSRPDNKTPVGSEVGSLQASLLDTGVGEEQIWELQPTNGIFDGLVLLGERRYDSSLLNEELNLQLPNVLASTSLPATSHRGTCTLDAGFLLIGTSENTIKLPSSEPGSIVSTSEPLAVNRSQAIPFISNLAPANWTVRFPGNVLSSIRLKLNSPPGSPLVIWKEKMELLAGSSVDEIACFYSVDGIAPIEIRFPRDLDFHDLSGAELVKSFEDANAKSLKIRPMENASKVGVHWRRVLNKPGLLRYFETPEIETDAMVFSKEIEVWPAANMQLLSFVNKRSPSEWIQTEADGYRVAVVDKEPILLVTKNFAMASAGAIALVVGALAWCVFRYANWCCLPILGSLSVCALLDPSWRWFIITFAVLPWVLGLLLASTALKPNSAKKLHRDDQEGSRARTSLRKSRVLNKAKSGLETVGIIAIAFAIQVSSSNAQQPPSERTDAPTVEVSPVPVLIPVTEDGQVAGDKVYIPGSFREMLFSTGKSKLKSSGNDFRSADYQVKLNPTGMTDLGEIVSIEATWRIEVDSTDQAVYLPVSGSVLDRLELIVDGVPTEIRAILDREGVSFRPPRSGGLVIRAQLTPTVVTTVAGANRIDLSIPPCAIASLSVTSDAPFEQISLPRCLGRINRFDTGNRVSAEMGGTDRLEIIWQRRGVGTTGNLTNFTRRWLVQIDENQISRELELAVGEGVRAGVVVDLFVDTPLAPLLTSSDWTIARNGANDTTMSRYRVVAVIDNPGPIRFLWATPLSSRNSRTIQLPDVRSNAQAGVIETLVGFHVDGLWNVIPDPVGTPSTDGGGNGVEIVSPEEFASKWSGYPMRIDASRRYLLSGPVEFQLVRGETRPWRMVEAHSIVLSEKSLLLDYEMSIDPGVVSQPPVVLRLPTDMKVERVLWNDREMIPELAGERDSMRLLLPELPRDRRTVCRVLGTFGLEPMQAFQFPRVRLDGIQASSSNYIIRRTEGLRLKELEPTLDVQPAAVTPEYDLSNGTVPLRAWSILGTNADQETFINGKYQLSPAVEEFYSRSLTALRWEEGSWRMETTLDIQPLRDAPDFLIFEIPSRWAQGLDVRPASKWSVQPTLDRSRLLLRVLPETTSADRLIGALGVRNEMALQRITIVSGLDNPGDGGVEVPDIRLLGKVESKRYFAAPKKLTSTEINWQTQNARPTTLPEELMEIAPREETHAFFEVLGDSFLATLTPAVSSEEAAFIPAHQIAVFSRKTHSSYTVVQRLFVNPGSLNDIKLKIPDSVRVLGVWEAGIPLPIPPSNIGEVTVPLALSRLCQEIVLLSETSSIDSDGSIPLVIPASVPVRKTWVSFYDDKREVHPIEDKVSGVSSWIGMLGKVDANKPTFSIDGQFEFATVSEFRVSSAEEIMTTLDFSVDNVAERSVQEKWRWLEPWLQQLRSLGWEPDVLLSKTLMGETPGARSDSPVTEYEIQGEEGLRTIARAQPDVSFPMNDRVATSVNTWLPKFLQQIFGTDAENLPLDALKAAPIPRLLVPPNWDPTLILVADYGVERIVSNRPVSAEFPGGVRMATIVIGMLLLGGFFSFGLLRLWFGERLCTQSQIWLIATGLVLCFLVPLPLAIGVMLLGLVTPILRNHLSRMAERRKSASVLRSDTVL